MSELGPMLCSSLLDVWPAHVPNGGVILTDRNDVVVPLITSRSPVHSGCCLGCALCALLPYICTADKLQRSGLSLHLRSYFMPHKPKEGGQEPKEREIWEGQERGGRRRRKGGRSFTRDGDPLCPWRGNFSANVKDRAAAAGAPPRHSFAWPDIQPHSQRLEPNISLDWLTN